MPLQTTSSVRLCRFGRRFLLNAKYPVIPTPSPPAQTGTETFPRHSRDSGNLELGVGETVLSDKFPHRQN
ncbi:hypothetical protein NEILACOT_04337 [Neisseria lactamica ATCC 23970]|uniref:Uncharacterized protein n=1 Tax=Neisseria lactamica ATCC 23970 TaxID=546265 RepID=D0W9X4_NEILA|nr:hypothetical protein NEILACOT_04337 [Neisseria lactamica ATCC 23970]